MRVFLVLFLHTLNDFPVVDFPLFVVDFVEDLGEGKHEESGDRVVEFIVLC
jgi:hypothetical protein